MLKKPAHALCTYGRIAHFASTCNGDITALKSQPSSPPRPSLRYNYHPQPPSRHYADVKPPPPADLSWPTPPSATEYPTPYEILKQDPKKAYDKRNYYELVKIYHPDKHSYSKSLSPSQSLFDLPTATKLERYRLLVRAHDILSDPSKRRAYDKYGLGWEGKPEKRSSRRYWTPEGDDSWSGFADNSCARNATWEDWEAWYVRRAGGQKQQPTYVSNGAFFALALTVVVLGAFGEMSRAGTMSRTFLQQIEAKHDESSKDLMKRRRESQGFDSNDERVQNFLKTREPEAARLISERETRDERQGWPRLLSTPRGQSDSEQESNYD